MISKLLKKLAKVEEYLIIILALIMVSLCIFQVVYRYIFQRALSWPEEMTRYIFVWVSFLGAALCIKRNMHFSIDIVINKLPKKLHNFFLRLNILLSILFSLVLFVFGLLITIRVSNQLSPAMELRMSIPYLILPVSSLLFILHLCEQWKYRKR